MSVKKLLLLTAAGIASVGMTTLAVAGGPDVAPAPADNGVYIDVNLGYAWHDWQNTLGNFVGNIAAFEGATGVTNWGSNANGGFAVSPDFGYQFNRFVAIEGGYWYLPQASASGTVTTPDGDFPVSGNIDNYALFLVAKFMAPVYENWDLFMKAGLAYRYSSFSGGNANFNNVGIGVFTAIVPTFSGGVQYTYDQNWRFNVMYTYIASNSTGNNASILTPNAHILTAGVGYLFAM